MSKDNLSYSSHAFKLLQQTANHVLCVAGILNFFGGAVIFFSGYKEQNVCVKKLSDHSNAAKSPLGWSPTLMLS